MAKRRIKAHEKKQIELLAHSMTQALNLCGIPSETNGSFTLLTNGLQDQLVVSFVLEGGSLSKFLSTRPIPH